MSNDLSDFKQTTQYLWLADKVVNIYHNEKQSLFALVLRDTNQVLIKGLESECQEYINDFKDDLKNTLSKTISEFKDIKTLEVKNKAELVRLLENNPSYYVSAIYYRTGKYMSRSANEMIKVLKGIKASDLTILSDKFQAYNNDYIVHL